MLSISELKFLKKVGEHLAAFNAARCFFIEAETCGFAQAAISVVKISIF